jgi:hypothetical protein
VERVTTGKSAPWPEGMMIAREYRAPLSMLRDCLEIESGPSGRRVAVGIPNRHRNHDHQREEVTTHIFSSGGVERHDHLVEQGDVEFAGKVQ